MGWIRKTVKKIGKGIKKIGKKIGKAFKSILKPFAKVFNKLGPLGSIAMMFILPGIGTALAGWGATIAGPTAGFLGKLAGTAVKFVGNAINFVATAPQKIFQTITSGVSSAWNGLFSKPITGGTIDALGAGAPNSWWGSFKNDMQNVWGNRGAINPTTGLIDPKTAGGNFWDVSKIGVEANKNLAAQWSSPQGFKEDIKNLFSRDPRTPLTEANAATTLTNPADLKTFTDTGTVTIPSTGTVGTKAFVPEVTYKLDRTGFFGNIKDVVGGTGKKIGDITVPGVGDVRDIAWGTSAAIGAYQAYAQINPDDPQGFGGSGLNALAEEQLYGGDQGGLYDMTKVKAWAYNPNIGATENSINYQNLYNQALGFPPDFNPMYSPYYGETYNQSFSRQLEAK